MKSVQEVSQDVDSWIAENDLPSRANLEVLKGFKPYAGMAEDEIEAYRDFMEWAWSREHLVLLSIPKQEPESDLWIEEDGEDV